MENTTLLFELLDGTLESVREEAMFRELAVNEDLRNEFRQITAMRNAVQSDTAAFIPPAESTVAIFRRLGFVPPAPPPAGFATKLATAAGHYTQAIVSGLTMTAITAAALFFLMPRQPEDSNKTINYKAGSTNSFSTSIDKGTMSAGEEAQKNSATNSTELRENLSDSKTDSHTSPPPREIIRYVYVNRPEQKISTQEGTSATKDAGINQSAADESAAHNQLLNDKVTATNPPEESTPIIAFAETHNAPKIAANSLLSGGGSNRRNPTLLPQFNSNAPVLQDNSSSAPTWEIGVRRLDSRSVESPTISNLSQSILNNTALTAMLPVFDDLKIGVEIAREEFFQRFEITENAKDTVFLRRYEQYPSLWSGGITGQYALAQWGQLSPFVQAGIGLSTIGPIGRFGVGLRYSPAVPLSFVLQFEASGLRYSEQGTTYYSGKYGISYGMNFSL